MRVSRVIGFLVVPVFFAVVAARADPGWAWMPITDPALPALRAADWPARPLDHFILARLEEHHLEPAPAAAPHTWIRRVTFDLTGLPPTPAEVRAFLHAACGARSRGVEDAKRAVVGRLLGSPSFGEHWAQHWLDLVRYAGTRGHEQDYEIPEAYRYRDYVIRALNADVPYDRFVTEHIAGDLVPVPRIDPALRTNESIQGTGFWHLGEAAHSPVDIRGEEADRIANQIDVFGKTFLGLTIGCARCHAHKFDPISQEDYYALYGFVQSSSYQLADVADPRARDRAFRDLTNLREDYATAILEDFATLVQSQVDTMASFLVAGHEVLAGADPERVSESSRRDRSVLDRWVKALEAAARDAGDPLYAFVAMARRCEEPGAGALEAAREVLDGWRRRESESRKRSRAQIVVTTIEEGERNFVRSERPIRDDDRIIEFGDHEDWVASGKRFGSGPVAPGTVIAGTDVARPIAHVEEEGSARSDLLSDRFSGMIRTRTFEVTSDTLWYRFTGKADCFLAVDSHRVVAGPLHGVLRQKLEGDRQPRWQRHDVRDYIGHRVHVEFTPRGDFSISRIQFAAAAPVEIFRANPILVKALETARPGSVGELARAWAGTLWGAVRDLAAGTVNTAGAPVAPGHAAAIVNWLIDHRDLLPVRGGEHDPMAARCAAYLERRRVVEKRIPEPIRALAMLDGSAENEPVHIRGNHATPELVGVPRRLPTTLDASNHQLSARGSGRLELARRLVDPSNPLVARVIVNRVWHHLFGRGIVPTADDFGAMGDRPSHPLLLDHLAGRLLRDGWSIKRLIRGIVLSSTYGMSSRPRTAAGKTDPVNRWLHRMRIRRLAGEAIRDSLLAVSGRLDRSMYGPGVRIHITPFMRGNRSPKWSGPVDGNGRRSIYVEVRRNHLSHFLTAFDRPVPFGTIGRRNVSNSPAQPLILLNDPLVHDLAAQWARRILSASEADSGTLVEHAYLEAFGRPPLEWEKRAALDFLGDRDDPETWTDLCHALFNVKEFIFLN